MGDNIEYNIQSKIDLQKQEGQLEYDIAGRLISAPENYY